jgi:glutathione S-transferase
VEHELVQVDLAQGAHKQPAFLALNPFGQVPVLEDDGTIVATPMRSWSTWPRSCSGATGCPDTPVAAAEVQKWLSVAAGQIAYGPAAARLVTVFGAPFRPEEVIQRAHGILALLDARLAGNAFVTGAMPTIADVALYSYTERHPRAMWICSPIPICGPGCAAWNRCPVSSPSTRRPPAWKPEQPTAQRGPEP